MIIAAPISSRALYHAQGKGPGPNKLPLADEVPNLQFEVHNKGKLAFTITNYGTFGTGFVDNPIIDGEEAPSGEFPINSNIEYLFTGALWIGAVIGSDTLVSIGADGWFTGITELNPEPGDDGGILGLTNLKGQDELQFSSDAVSEQDFISTFTDTFTNVNITGQDEFDNRLHQPLNIAVRQASYVWSYDYAEDFVLIDYKFTNIGLFPIQNMYIGIYIDGDVFHQSKSENGFEDDICGFRQTVPDPANFPCKPIDTINVAWIADNDGDPNDAGLYGFSSPIGLTGTRVVRTPSEELEFSFNWWISNGNASLDFGPRLRGTEEKPFFPFPQGNLGTPTGDIVKYYIMSSNEFDYDQLFTAISHVSEGYLSPPPEATATDFANGYDTRYLLSFGPFNVQPEDTLPITIAYMAADSVHRDPDAFRTLFDAGNPQPFYDQLDFTDVGVNARWADWIYDNPGFDTDNDGDSGEYYWRVAVDTGIECYFKGDVIPDYDCDLDPENRCTKVFFKGDGVPDFRGAAPPPPPVVRVTPGRGEVSLQWNGQEAENFIDPFANEKDFEGYRVYYAQGNQLSDFVLLASYDIEDYRVFKLTSRPDTVFWEQQPTPSTIEDLQDKYGSDFDPNRYYNEFNAFVDSLGEFFYFAPVDWNESDLSDPNRIYKVYPNASRDDATDTTSEGLQRFYEYAYRITNLQPSVSYNFAVTTFDYGSLNVELGALESSPLTNAVEEFPLTDADEVEETGMEVIVYPNPYRIDAGYAEQGYENRDRTLSAERARKINFANLPRVCTIKIYSIDGDLINTIEHNYPEGGPRSQHATWDVISRNTQSVVTGIYLWHVQSEMGEQIGKLVIIK